MKCQDVDYMSQALCMARRGLGTTWPNPSVGCVIVSESGVIVGRGVTAPGGRPHAEAIALAQAGERAIGATAYVTLEPCAHEGRGEACAHALSEAGLRRVVVAIRDPDPRTAGSGIDKLKSAGVTVTEGILADDATEITRGHILRVEEHRPEVILKLAVGSDGRIPEGNGSPVWVTGEAARAHAHLQRARCDAILVGRGTVATDDPSLTCRLPGMECRSPVRVVLDRKLRTPKKAQLFDDEMVPVWFVCADEPQVNESALQERGAEIIRVGVDEEGYPCVREALEGLALAGITRVLVEGGPAVAKSFLDADLIDEALIYQGADEVGPEGLLPFVTEGLDKLTDSGRFEKVHTRCFGRDKMTEWQRKRKCSPASLPT
jgi:diaminohydroxyphosphoribosylaminopyrimidine deaminase/5-amino-6-(5-phosphoribosylamino)uracil reductase